MIRLFGSWIGYRSTPPVVVQEQVIVWSSRLKVKAEQAEEEQRKIEAAQRR